MASFPKKMIELNADGFRDRVYACWLGKNIGGTLGGPYEGMQCTLDVQGFSSEPGKPRPNDDLDLQLIWLHVMEKAGPLAIRAEILGEYWISLIPPNWNEYGIGKNNMRRGLVPPFSGEYQNNWKNSNGAWIRTEIWACMAPGCPVLAAKYAMEDGKVDHGMGEGTLAAAFVAAMQSAAFVLRDLRACIEIGLSLIPTTSRMADSVRFILSCFDSGMTAMEARNAILARNADIGDGWFEAPSNVSYVLIGLLWGGGDFKKSMLTTINCGDDTDCTGATVGATLGILGGMDVIPEDWRQHVGDDIVTISINRSDNRSGAAVPATCTELTRRVTAQTPHVLFANRQAVCLTSAPDNIPADIKEYLALIMEKQRKELSLSFACTAHFESAALCADVSVCDGADIAPLQEKRITATVYSQPTLGDEPVNLTCRWWLPDGFRITEGKQTAFVCRQCSCYSGKAELSFTVAAGGSGRAHV